MSFTIRPDEPMRRAIRRLARAQLRKAAETLNDHQRTLSERVHQMRTSIKKVRALVALTRPTVGKSADLAHRRLRNIAAATSELRDAEMVLHTLDTVAPRLTESLATGTPRSSTIALAGTRNRLVARLRKSERSFEAARCLDVLAAQLCREAHRVRRWIPAGTGPWRELQRSEQVRGQSTPLAPLGTRKNDRRVGAAALALGYRRARRAMARAYSEDSGEAFHDWRKAVKAHRYQLQLLRGAWPAEAAARLPDLERLGELLGDEHDLTVLKQTVVANASPKGHGDEADLLALVRQRRATLRADARPLGERLFADRARVFRGRLSKSAAGASGEPINQGVRNGARTSRTTSGGATSRPARLTAV